MREVIAIASLLFFLAISGSEASVESGGNSCRVNAIVELVDGC